MSRFDIFLLGYVIGGALFGTVCFQLGKRRGARLCADLVMMPLIAATARTYQKMRETRLALERATSDTAQLRKLLVVQDEPEERDPSETLH